MLDFQTKGPELELLHPQKKPDTSHMPANQCWELGKQKTVRSQEPPTLVKSASTRFTERYCLKKSKVELGMVTDTFSPSIGRQREGESQFQATWSI